MRGKRVRMLADVAKENENTLRLFFGKYQSFHDHKKINILRKLKQYWRKYKTLPEVVNG